MPIPPFIRQDGEPLYPKILWNRPISRHGAGGLLVVGGHKSEFSLPTAMYQLSMAAGIGRCSVVLPDSLLKVLGGLPGTHFVASTQSGSVGREALGQILAYVEEADALVLGASLSANSSTSMLVERLVQESIRPIIAFDDALISLQHNLRILTDNPECLLIVTMPELFKIAGALGIGIQIRPGGGLISKLEIIESIRAVSACTYVVYGSEIIISSPTEPIVTPINYRISLIPAAIYGVLSVFWVQNPSNPMAGLATGSYVLRRLSEKLGATDRPSTSQLATFLTEILNEQG